MATRCISIASRNEPNRQCQLLAVNGNTYCALHLSQAKKVDFDKTIHERDEFNIVNTPVEPKKPKLDLCTLVYDEETGTKKYVYNEIINRVQRTNATVKKVDESAKKPMPKHSSTMSQKIHQDAEDNLKIKLLVLVNDTEYSEIIPALIGPVFHDVTISDDDQDAITFDTIWFTKSGTRVPGPLSKYYLFSYRDSSNKIRCFTVFSIYEMVQTSNFVHPLTGEEMQPADIERAKKLVDIYNQNIGLFSAGSEVSQSFEDRLTNRITQLFKQFHVHSIFLEEKWLTDIASQKHLDKVIQETGNLVSNARDLIGPNCPAFFKKKPNFAKNESELTIINCTKVYIVDEWEKMISFAANPQNQIPIWIIASGLSFIIPAVKQKFPSLEIML